MTYYDEILNKVTDLILNSEQKPCNESLSQLIHFLDKYKLNTLPTIFLVNGKFELMVGSAFFLKFTGNKILSRLLYGKYEENALTAFLLCYNLTHFFEGDVIASLAQRESTALTQQLS